MSVNIIIRDTGLQEKYKVYIVDNHSDTQIRFKDKEEIVIFLKNLLEQELSGKYLLWIEFPMLNELSIKYKPMAVKSPMAKKAGAKNNKAKKLTPKKVAKKGKK